MVFINDTGLIYSFLEAFSNNVTGDFFLTLFFLFVFVLALTFAFRIPIEFGLLFLVPLVLALGVYNGTFAGILFAVLFFIGFVLTKFFFGGIFK